MCQKLLRLARQVLDRFRDAYWDWVDATQGRVPEPSQVFGGRLPCAYVMSDRDHAAFLERAERDPGLEEVLADAHMVLYRVRPDRWLSFDFGDADSRRPATRETPND